MLYKTLNRKSDARSIQLRACAATRRNARSAGSLQLLEPLENRTLFAGGPAGGSEHEVPVGPTSLLLARGIAAARDGSYSFTVTYSDPDGVSAASIDSSDIRVTGPGGYERTATLVALDENADGVTRVGHYKIAAPNGHWNEAADGQYIISLRSSQVRDVLGNPANAGIVGQFRVTIGQPSGSSTTGTNTATQGILASNFGAIANDWIDDTAAIQAAIDSLPKASGNPGGEVPNGGIVQLGVGLYITSSALKLPSGVELRGAGAGGTMIKNFSLDRKSGAIELVSPYTHGYNIAAAVRDLGIYTYYAAGIKCAAIKGELVDLSITNIRLSAGGVGIDLRNAACYYADISQVTVYNPGSTALWIGKFTNSTTDWGGAVNRIEGFRTASTARANFAAERGLVVLGGDTTWIGGAIEGVDAMVTPLYVHGSSSITGLWTEYRADKTPGGKYVVFDNCTYVSMNRLINAKKAQKVTLINSPVVNIDVMPIEYAGDRIQDCVSIDAHSHLTIGTVYSQYDSGGFDDPRMTVRSNYRISTNSLFQNMEPGANLLADPTFATFGKPGQTSWNIQWGDTSGAVTGTATVEQTAAGPRLKIVITSNPNNRSVNIFGAFNTPPGSIGRRGVALWRIDGSYGGASAWAKDYRGDYQASAMNTRTGGRSPQVLAAKDQIIFVISGAKGTYYLSKVSVAADVS